MRVAKVFLLRYLAKKNNIKRPQKVLTVFLKKAQLSLGHLRGAARWIPWGSAWAPRSYPPGSGVSCWKEGCKEPNQTNQPTNQPKQTKPNQPSQTKPNQTNQPKSPDPSKMCFHT